jgi:transposase
MSMIVIGADAHKRSHTVAAVAAPTGELLGGQTVPVGRRGFGALLQWARGLDGDRVWALEDCRHVSGSLERFLIERGERVLRIPTHLTAKARKSARQRGKSDLIERGQRRSRRIAGRHGVVPDGALGRARARPAAAGRPPRAARRPPR